ncbi:MAG TPA: thioredoxin [Candidatus Xenobia bacterium]|jgi:thioredoxin 1
MSTIPHVSTTDFDTQVKASPIPVLVDFYAQWCGPCKMMSPVIEKIADQFGTKLKVVKIDTDESPEVATQYQILGVPTLIIFKGGEPVGKQVGYMSERDMQSFVTKYLS